MAMIVFAYIDPGLGALAWQIIVSGFVGALFFLKQTRKWIVGIVFRWFR